MSKTVSVAEAAEFLGVNKKKIIDLIEEGRLPALKMGGAERNHYRVRAVDLNRLFTAQTTESVA